MFSTQSAHAASNNPLFDRLYAERTTDSRPVARITTMTRYLERATAPTAAAAPTTRPRRLARAAAPAAPAVGDLLREPLTTDDLTADERAIVAEMGGTVARLILKMLDDDQSL